MAKRLIDGPTLLVDQYGQRVYVTSLKELRAACPGRVSRMYRDKKDGAVVQCGYVIGQRWLTAYKPVEVRVN